MRFGGRSLLLICASRCGLGKSRCQSLSISAHSLCKVVHYAKPSLANWGSVITLTYQASQRAEASYGLMGVAKSALESCVRFLAIEMGQKRVRVNAISPGPIETPAAVGEVLAFLRDTSSMDKTARQACCNMRGGSAAGTAAERTSSSATDQCVSFPTRSVSPSSRR